MESLRPKEHTNNAIKVELPDGVSLSDGRTMFEVHAPGAEDVLTQTELILSADVGEPLEPLLRVEPGEESVDLLNTQTIAEVPEQPEAIEYVQVDPITVTGSVVVGGLGGALGKLRHRKAAQRASDRAEHIDQDSGFVRKAASDVQAKHKPPKRTPEQIAEGAKTDGVDLKYDYDPLGGFDNKHMTRKLADGFGEGTHVAEPKHLEKIDNPANNPGSELQRTAAMRANLRDDAIIKRRDQSHELVETWGHALHSKEETEAMINNGRYNRSQKRAIRRAGRRVRANDDAITRISGRQDRQASGESNPVSEIQDWRSERADTKALKAVDRARSVPGISLEDIDALDKIKDGVYRRRQNRITRRNP